MEKKKLQIRGTPSQIKPVFADEAMVGISIKATKAGNEVKKQGVIRLSFIDVIRKQMLSEVVLLPETAKALHRVLGQTLRKFEEEIKSKELPKALIRKETSTGYIG